MQIVQLCICIYFILYVKVIVLLYWKYIHCINYKKYFCTYVIRGNVQVVKICVCSEFAMSAAHAYSCSVGRGWVGIVIVSLG
jgi:hypothetical protein